MDKQEILGVASNGRSMEWLWTLAGVAVGGVLAYGLARWNALAGLPRARPKPVEERTPEELIRVVKGLIADVEDVLERERRMYDRLRKRAPVDAVEVPREDVPNGLTRMTPGQIMQFGRERGIVR